MRRSSLRWLIPTLLSLQLAMLYIQGAQIHRQNQLLQALREDVQELADSLPTQDGEGAQATGADAVPAARRALRSAPGDGSASQSRSWLVGVLGGAGVLVLARLLARWKR